MNLCVVLTHSTLYHPQGTDHCERENRTIWRAMKNLFLTMCFILSGRFFALHLTKLPMTCYFHFPGKHLSYFLPTWLSQPETVLVRKFIQESKSHPLAEPIDLISATAHYARIRCPDGREASLH